MKSQSEHREHKFERGWVRQEDGLWVPDAYASMNARRNEDLPENASDEAPTTSATNTSPSFLKKLLFYLFLTIIYGIVFFLSSIVTGSMGLENNCPILCKLMEAAQPLISAFLVSILANQISNKYHLVLNRTEFIVFILFLLIAVSVPNTQNTTLVGSATPTTTPTAKATNSPEATVSNEETITPTTTSGARNNTVNVPDRIIIYLERDPEIEEEDTVESTSTSTTTVPTSPATEESTTPTAVIQTATPTNTPTVTATSTATSTPSPLPTSTDPAPTVIPTDVNPIPTATNPIPTATPTDPPNTVPELIVEKSFSVDEGGMVRLFANATDAEGNCLYYDWDFDADGNFEVQGQEVTFSAEGLDGPDLHIVFARVTDCDGLSDVKSAQINILNVSPSGDVAALPSQLSEGGETTLFVNNLSDPSIEDMVAGLRFSYACGNPDIFDAIDITDTSFICNYPQDGHYTAVVRIRDKDGGEVEYPVSVLVENVSPTIQEMTVSPEIGIVNWNVRVEATFTDPGNTDDFAVVCGWGDGNVTNGMAEMIGEVGSAYCEHNYKEPGIYEISLTVSDGDGGQDSSKIVDYSVIGQTGSIVGEGEIISPEGAYVENPALTGEGEFVFNIRAGEDGDVEGRFHFRLENGFRFQADNISWLVITESLAQVQGTGSINNTDGYTFVLTVLDGQLSDEYDEDMIRIQLVDSTTGEVIYDTQMGDALDAEPITGLVSGQITINPAEIG